MKGVLSWSQATWVCTCLIAGSTLLSVISIHRVQSRQGDTPFLSANDRSRWATIAALVEDGTFSIDRWQDYRDPQTKARSYQSIDRVRHVDGNGIAHDYSSKPPLLPIVQAGVYALVRMVMGYRLPEDPFGVGRSVLVVFNALPWGVALVVLAQITRRVCNTPLGWVYVVAAGGFATLLLPMTVTLNNHLPAAIGALVGFAILQSDPDGELSTARGWVAGLAAGWMAACELPALSLLMLWGGWLAWFHRSALGYGYLPGVLLLGLCSVAANFAAHGTWRPAYSQRDHDPLYVSSQYDVPNDLSTLNTQEIATQLLQRSPFPGARVVEVRRSERSEEQCSIDEVTIDQAPWRLALRVSQSGLTQLRGWGDWYDYPGSYWTGRQQGVDRGEPSRLTYAWHALSGHHGVFSLTPLWLLLPWGCWLHWRRASGSRATQALVATVAVASLVCVVFYLTRPQIDRNYGGVSCGFRWMFWFALLWIWLIAPAADRLFASSNGRILAMALLLASLPAALLALANPWQHPWLYRWLYD